VTEVGDGFVRVDIEGVRWGTTPGQHAYLYFPTLNPLRPWENHPFSILPSSILAPPSIQGGSKAPSEVEPATPPESDPEKAPTKPTTTKPVPNLSPKEAGITLFIRKSTGMTRALKSHPSLLTLLDGPYPNNPTAAILQCDRVLLIAGGIGITGLLPWTRTGQANVKLWWSVRESAACLVDALGAALDGVKEKEVRVGGRLDVRGLLREEGLVGWKRIGVVVCGPGGLCDEVRAVVAEMGRREKGVVWELEVDAYSW
jgi:predicted ferric reductase